MKKTEKPEPVTIELPDNIPGMIIEPLEVPEREIPEDFNIWRKEMHHDIQGTSWRVRNDPFTVCGILWNPIPNGSKLGIVRRKQGRQKMPGISDEADEIQTGSWRANKIKIRGKGCEALPPFRYALFSYSMPNSLRHVLFLAVISPSTAQPLSCWKWATAEVNFIPATPSILPTST